MRQLLLLVARRGRWPSHREREPHTTVGFVAKACMVKRGPGISGAELEGPQVIVELSPSFKSFTSSCSCFVSSSSTLCLCDPIIISVPTVQAHDPKDLGGIVMARRRL
jgi:hypothetical protein